MSNKTKRNQKQKAKRKEYEKAKNIVSQNMPKNMRVLFRQTGGVTKQRARSIIGITKIGK
jgi:endonuclease V-like protein UPF0215 family